MPVNLFRKIFPTKNDRDVKKIRPVVAQINEIEAGLQKLSDDELRAKTAAWKAELAQIEDDAELARKLDEILPEAFAVVKNVCRRLCGQDVIVREHPIRWEMVPFDVQLIGGYGLHHGHIAEMATGEGKTLVATMPIYLNALTGRGVHVVTVNDYLAARDSEWMGAIYRFLGLTVGVILHDQSPKVRREQYECDITYGTNSEFGFDYLRDNGMALGKEEQVQRGHYFAIVDEVDSILIDEARTPLIISGPAVHTFDEQYGQWKPTVEGLVRAQQQLCGRFLKEAEELLKKLQPTDGSNVKDAAALENQTGLLLFRVKTGQPKSEALLKILENPANAGLMNRAELDLHKDQKKVDLYREKEELLFAIDEKGFEADLTEKGRNFVSPKDPEAFVLPELTTALHEIDAGPEPDARKRMEAKTKVQQDFETKAQKIHAISQLLKAYSLYQLDVEYVIRENKVIIVDQHTGRLMPGRRWSDGLHQAVEAKEGVAIERETQTLATITIQNYFRLYKKLAGMTGTAETEATEFENIYKLGVIVVPTNKPCVRKDENDVVYKTRREKYNAIIEDIVTRHRHGQPSLVGTVSVEASEVLSRMLGRQKVPHNVLNAKYHQREAEIIARAGQKGSVTIATNMAGRGTDIKLGEGVSEVGGLHVVGSERHEARRIGRQLRGRCARQGDPGSSRFYVSLEDDLMRLFGSGRIATIMEKLGMKEGEELEHPLLNRSIETAQRRVEEHNFSIRKRTLEYDDVMNKQREVLYGFRNDIIRGENPREAIFDIIEEVVEARVVEYCPEDKQADEWEIDALLRWSNQAFPIGLRPEHVDDKTRDEVLQAILDKVNRAYEAKAANENAESLKAIERLIVLNALDRLWQEHLYNMDQLRNGIGLQI